MGKVRIIEVPCDLGAGKRGASLGIEALKLQAVQEGKQLFWQKDIKSAKNINSILHAHEPIAKTGKFVNEIASICEEATSLVEERACWFWRATTVLPFQLFLVWSKHSLKKVWALFG